MATIAENRQTWDGVYDWDTGGEEWSGAWGSSATQWSASIAPRLLPLLPAKLLLEIAPGAGRWTRFLLDHCDRYLGIDLSDRSVAICRERFRDQPKARFQATDGRSMEAAESRSVDVCFSFDSLVHADPDVIAAYVGELARVLSDDGIAFIHHSNRGGLGSEGGGIDRLSWRVDQLRRWTIRRHGLAAVIRSATTASQRQRVWRTGWRSETMSAAAFQRMTAAAGLRCVGQELISWPGTHRLIDCISLAARPGSRWDRPNVIARNHAFVGEAVSADRRSSIFDSLPTRPKDTKAVS